MQSPQDLFINRELSWLEFNQRVLDEALNKEVPLLERVKFLSISGSNLDEFFMVRVGGLRLLDAEGIQRQDITGASPARQLKAIGQRVHRMVAAQYACANRHLFPALAAAGIRRIPPGEWSPSQAAMLSDMAQEILASQLTPMAIQSGEPFPLLRPLALHLAVRFETGEPQAEPELAILPVAGRVQRWIRLRGTSYPYVPLETALEHFLPLFFPGRKIAECAAFRITRNADIAVREDLAPDLLSGMQAVLAARKDSGCVRLEIESRAGKKLLEMLRRNVAVPADSVYRVPGPVDISSFMALTAFEGLDEQRDPPWIPQDPPEFDPSVNLCETLAEHDLLLVHPYESFDPVVKLVTDAAEDPEVLAIKQILYRTSRHSPLVDALKRAAENGKAVSVLVEIKARFDEALNIEWARDLERSGAQVIYGVKGLKTHAKLCIIVRREPGGIRRYLHFGTGNYNEKTARLYSDVSYLTADETLGSDASAFFNAICGHSEPAPFLKLEAAPMRLRERLLELIAEQIEAHRQGRPARIMAKMNSLVDPKLIRALYRASRAGVPVLLNVRGICCLRPNLAGQSETIRVVSIIDRYLEHARIYSFGGTGEEQVFLSSADWMPRNLDRRIELLVPVESAQRAQRLVHVLQTYFQDTVKARWMRPDGTYEKPRRRRGRPAYRAQEVLYREACQTRASTLQHRRTVFEPHLPPEEPRN